MKTLRILVKNIITQYPILFKNKHRGILTGDGWYNLVIDMCENLYQLKDVDYVSIHKIYNYYGDLKVDYTVDYFNKKYDNFLEHFKILRYNIFKDKFDSKINVLKKDVADIINLSIHRSTRICENCGKDNIEKMFSLYHENPVCQRCVEVFEKYTYSK